jgi:hypothetical protein
VGSLSPINLCRFGCQMEERTREVRPVFSSGIGSPELLQCALNAHCSNLFVFGKNCLNFD